MKLTCKSACIYSRINYIYKENTSATLVLIGTDEVAFHVDVTATQAFELKTQKDSSGEEFGGGDTELDYNDDERASVLPDEEDRKLIILQRVA